MGRGDRQLAAIDMRRKEAELANLRARRNVLEEAARRVSSSSVYPSGKVC
jgi:hypothetical protein